MAERTVKRGFPDIPNFLENYLPTQDEIRALIHDRVSPEMWEILSTPPQLPPKISPLQIPDGVDRSLWLNYLIEMHWHGITVDASDFHQSYPQVPFITANPCPGGEIHRYNHSFQLNLVEWSWCEAVADYDIPSWSPNKTIILTPHFTDGDWMDNFVIGEREHILRKKFYSHGICSECRDHKLEQRLKSKDDF